MRIGSLFSGYMGLDMAVEEVFGATTAWVSDIDKGACKILAHRAPGVPNLGDITSVDWATVEPVDIITGGSPCQDLSHAGKRSGMTAGTRSNLWVAMREAIAQLRPRYVIWENVRGAYSAEADSELEFCPGCMGDPGLRGPVLHALGRVLGDLSDLGYDCRWHGLRAADVGAPHGRFRVFVVARDASLRGWDDVRIANWGREPEGSARGSDFAAPVAERSGWERWGSVQLNGASGHAAGNGEGTLLPTPRATDGTKGGPSQRGSSGDLMLPSAVQSLGTPTSRDFHGLLRGHDQWGMYAAAINRWELILGRPAPDPTRMSSKGNPQLSAHFVEFMMGLPAGWVTDVPGITRNEALKALGNGVVSQQCAAALRTMLAWSAVA